MRNRIASSGQRRALVRRNIRLAKLLKSGGLGPGAIDRLRHLTIKFGFSSALGDFQYLDSGWYVTHAGLLRLAERRRCVGIGVHEVRHLSDALSGRWVFKANVYKTPGSRGFSGYGDADPSNVSPLVRGAEMRVAETRAVNRALRKAYGIGLCSVEELGWEPKAYGPPDPQRFPSASNNNGHQNGHTRLRDRLCLLIRQHQLDANLVKAYAADSCGTPNLRDATREQIEAFIANLADWATKDRPALLCKLNSYSRSQEVTS
jgi:hypothetical protein